jgi:hypothetical protein
LIVLAGIIVFFYSCEKKRTEANLKTDLTSLDMFLRNRPFHYDSMKIYLAHIAEAFVHRESRELSYDAWKTSVTWKWNTDSPITMIHAKKFFPVGFSREMILHSGDSTLFVHRFSTQPLGAGNKTQLTFLESVFYLAETGTLKHLARISYRPRSLKDTVAFRKKPFADLTDDISHYYSLELDHSKHILTLN